MPPDARKLLRDMQQSAAVIAEAARGKTQAIFEQDRILRDAVQWNFAVIGEALSALRHAHSSVAEQISEWPRIIGFRNQLIHGYSQINHDITWRIIREKVPILIAELEELLKQ